MSSWKVILTPDFKSEVRGIHSYIVNTLLSPAAANKQIKKIIDATSSLEEMPNRHAIYDKEPWKSRRLRKLPVDNYIIFYMTNENTNEVIVAHVLYGGQNIAEILKNEVTDDGD